jgi:hypothetical protein
MSLTEKDLENIKDIVDFSIEKSEINMTEKIENGLVDLKKEMIREISDLAETNRAFMSKLDNHETRIDKLELKTGLATK